MSTKSSIQVGFFMAFVGLGTGGTSLAHEVVGVQSYYACQLTRARAFLRSPNPGAGNRDYPLAVVDPAGSPTGEHIVVITIQNASDFDARLTALGFAWSSDGGSFDLVQLYRGYNDLTANNAGVRTGTIAPNDYAVVSAFTLVQAPNVELSVRPGIQGVPGFPDTNLSFALATGNTFSGGRPTGGLATDGTRHQIAFKGVLPAGANGSPDIEELLNRSYVRFRQVGADSDGAETGIWRNLLPPATCP